MIGSPQFQFKIVALPKGALPVDFKATVLERRFGFFPISLWPKRSEIQINGIVPGHSLGSTTRDVMRTQTPFLASELSLLERTATGYKLSASSAYSYLEISDINTENGVLVLEESEPPVAEVQPYDQYNSLAPYHRSSDSASLLNIPFNLLRLAIFSGTYALNTVFLPRNIVISGGIGVVAVAVSGNMMNFFYYTAGSMGAFGVLGGLIGIAVVFSKTS